MRPLEGEAPQALRGWSKFTSMLSAPSCHANALAHRPGPRSEATLQAMADGAIDAVLRVEQAAHPQPWGRKHFEDIVQAGPDAGYAAQLLIANQQLLGYFVALRGVDEAHLLNITVAPLYQRQGWARLLLAALDLWARGQGAQCLWLEVRLGNLPARALYQAHGYQEVGQRKNYYPASNGQREDALVLRLKL